MVCARMSRLQSKETCPVHDVYPGATKDARISPCGLGVVYEEIVRGCAHSLDDEHSCSPLCQRGHCQKSRSKALASQLQLKSPIERSEVFLCMPAPESSLMGLKRPKGSSSNGRRALLQ